MCSWVPNLRVEEFCTFLCQREDEVVGYAGYAYRCPLAQWLSTLFEGQVYGVDGTRYGRASCDPRGWLPLPRWAVIFVALTERYFPQALTGTQAFDLLAQVSVSGGGMVGKSHARRKGNGK